MCQIKHQSCSFLVCLSLDQTQTQWSRFFLFLGKETERNYLSSSLGDSWRKKHPSLRRRNGRVVCFLCIDRLWIKVLFLTAVLSNEYMRNKWVTFPPLEPSSLQAEQDQDQGQDHAPLSIDRKNATTEADYSKRTVNCYCNWLSWVTSHGCDGGTGWWQSSTLWPWQQPDNNMAQRQPASSFIHHFL